MNKIYKNEIWICTQEVPGHFTRGKLYGSVTDNELLDDDFHNHHLNNIEDGFLDEHFKLVCRDEDIAELLFENTSHIEFEVSSKDESVNELQNKKV